MRLAYFTLVILAFFSSCTREKPLVEFETAHLKIGVSDKGSILELTDLNTGKNYISMDTLAPLISCRIDSQMYYPEKASFSDGTLNISFKGDLIVSIKVIQQATHITFELIEFNRTEDLDLVVWGPIPNTINEVIGETVGVVQGKKFALGIQSLNPKTLGGYPWTDNDCTPQFDIFEQEDYSDLSEENKREVLYRIEAAKPEKFGSSLQAYCRNRNKERIINNLNHERYVSPVFNDGGIIGSKIALFGCPVQNTLETIGKIEIAEGLPHPTIDGEWGKMAKSASAAYLIYSFNEHNIEEAIEYTKKAGLRYLYHPGPFKNWGHFELNEKEFPNGWEGLKSCVEKAEKEGILLGVHTLSNFTTTNDPYVTPVPDSRLAKVGSTLLSDNIDAFQTEIPIESPDFFNQYENNNLHGVRIGNELIRYHSVTSTAPFKLLNCERGAWGTSAENHKIGASISKLADHGYKVFLTSTELSLELAERLARLYSFAGLRQISFDGLEGNRSTGMGNYGEILFTKTWYDNLTPEIKNHLITDASRTTHYFWHIYSRMNWGEPWYAGFRESQTEYRLKNQAYFQRNLMPGMLGWFSMRNNTPIEDIEWMLARSAAFNAGYAFVAGERELKTNGQSNEILQSIGEWENARMAEAFSEEQKEAMKDIKKEFSLEKSAEDVWNLRPIHSFKFNHEAKIRQPGEPLYSKFNVDNPESEKTFQFILTAYESSVSEIRIELNNSREIVLPVVLNEGESLKYTGGNSAIVLDRFLNAGKTISINPQDFILRQGNNSVVFDCLFDNKGKNPMVKFEVRIPGKTEVVRAKN